VHGLWEFHGELCGVRSGGVVERELVGFADGFGWSGWERVECGGEWGYWGYGYVGCCVGIGGAGAASWGVEGREQEEVGAGGCWELACVCGWWEDGIEVGSSWDPPYNDDERGWMSDEYTAMKMSYEYTVKRTVYMGAAHKVSSRRARTGAYLTTCT